jgi:hypothetical protein
MSDADTEYSVETEDELTSEVEDEEEIDEVDEDEYEDAIEKYAQMIREVPQAKLDGIVERVQELFENQNADGEKILEEFNNDNICYVIFMCMLIMFTGSVMQLLARQKTDCTNCYL